MFATVNSGERAEGKTRSMIMYKHHLYRSSHLRQGFFVQTSPKTPNLANNEEV